MEIGSHPLHTTGLPTGDADLSSLTFPSLRELRLLNTLTSKLVLDKEHYPQLRTVVIKNNGLPGRNPSIADQLRAAFEQQPVILSELLLQLDLPLLLTLELECCTFRSASLLAACLSASACPRLTRFIAADITFPNGLQTMILDMPSIQRFELRKLDVHVLELRAPSLTDLVLTCCSRLGAFTLLPDGDPPLVAAAADAADTAVLVPASTKNTMALETMFGPVHAFFQGTGLQIHESACSRKITPPVKVCVPCGRARVLVMTEGKFPGHGSPGWQALRHDSRVRSVIDLGYLSDGEPDLEDD